MITIFAKDLRENLKWAVLILIGTALTCAAVTKDAGTLMYWLLEIQPATMLCAAIGGLGLGILQFIFDARRDHYAFLVHRPLSRTRIFIAKALAGLLLLTVAVAVPYLLSVAWVAAPSHQSFPFRWQMMLPALADTLCGFAYYFAGVLIAMREARWYASRVLVIGTAIACSIVLWIVPQFWQALIIIVVASLITGLAAWGAFRYAGEYEPQPHTIRAVLGVALFPGLCILTIGAIAILDDFLADSRQGRTYTQYEFSRGGELLRIVSEPGLLPAVTDLDGRQLAEYAKDVQDWHKLRARFVPMGWLNWTRYDTLLFSVDGYRSPYHWIRPLRGAVNGEEWYFDIARQQIVGYDRVRHNLIGTITPSGFHPPDARLTDCFPDTPQTIAERYLTFGEAVYEIDTAARKVTLIQKAGPDESFFVANKVSDTNGRELLGIVGRKSIQVLDNGRPVLTTPNLADGKYTTVGIGQLDKPSHFIMSYNPRLTPMGIDPRAMQLAVEIGPDGKVIHRYDLPLNNYRPNHPRYVGIVTPPILAGVYGGIAAVNRQLTGDESLLYPFCSPEDGLATLLITLAIGAVLAAGITLWLARRYAFSPARVIGWTFANLLLGIPGLLLMLSLIEWPATVRCSACSRRRLAVRETCDYCGASISARDVDGTEIFEPTPSAA